MTPQEKARAKRLRDNFDLSPEDWDAIHEFQLGVCFLCHKPQKSGKRLATDHCHKTGLVRGLLCSQCNRLLGKIERGQWNAAIIARVVEYWANPPSTQALGRTVIGYAGRTGTKKQRLELRRRAKVARTKAKESSKESRNPRDRCAINR